MKESGRSHSVRLHCTRIGVIQKPLMNNFRLLLKITMQYSSFRYVNRSKAENITYLCKYFEAVIVLTENICNKGGVVRRYIIEQLVKIVAGEFLF